MVKIEENTVLTKLIFYSSFSVLVSCSYNKVKIIIFFNSVAFEMKKISLTDKDEIYMYIPVVV